MSSHMFNPTLMDRATPTQDMCDSKLGARLASHGFCILGAFTPTERSRVPDLKSGERPLSVTLVGNAGPDMWKTFLNERQDEPNPLDNWVQRVMSSIGKDLNLDVLLPNEGPPYYPFQAWGEEAHAFFPTPAMPSIHPRYGTWFGTRAAFLSAEPTTATAPEGVAESPCVLCLDKLCLQTCPCGALGPKNYDIALCMDYTKSSDGYPCLKNGCRSRHACPIGQEYAYSQDQAEFHMRGCIDLYNTAISAT